MDFGNVGGKEVPKIVSWIGNSKEKNPRVIDGKEPLLNEPSGIFGHEVQGKLKGLFIADTSNNCVRYASLNGEVETLKIEGIPDVRKTNECEGGMCVPDFSGIKL